MLARVIRLDTLSLGERPPEEVNVVVTQPPGSDPLTVAVDPKSGVVRVDRLHDTAMRVPGTLGLIPRTRVEGGRALSAFLPIAHQIAAGLVLSVRPIGVVYLSGADHDLVTIVAVPVSRVGARYDKIRSYTDIPGAQLRQLSHFLSHMADLEDDQQLLSAAWGDVSEAHRIIEEAARRAQPQMDFASD